MAKICEKLRIYLGIGLSVSETAKIFGKWLSWKCLKKTNLKYVGKFGSYVFQNIWENMWEMKWGNVLIICQTS